MYEFGKWNYYLIPCPGPHLSLLMKTFSDPWIIEIQSSPVWMVFLAIITLMELLIWMPSVLGLVSGAISLSLRNLTFVHLVTNMWNPLGFSDLMFCTMTLLQSMKKRLCIPTNQYFISDHVNERVSLRATVSLVLRDFVITGSSHHMLTYAGVSDAWVIIVCFTILSDLPWALTLSIKSTPTKDFEAIDMLEHEPVTVFKLRKIGTSQNSAFNLQCYWMWRKAWPLKKHWRNQESPSRNQYSAWRRWMAHSLPCCHESLHREPSMLRISGFCYKPSIFLRY